MTGGGSPPAALRRVLTFWPLVFYGLSVIVGAGIYVALGAVIDRAGDAAPVSFLLAGIAAALTGLCYAEMAGRFPEASGGVAFVRHGFGSDRLAQLVGLAIATAVVVAAASIASGAVHYLIVLVPLPATVLTIILVVFFTAIAALGVRESVGMAAAMGCVEVAGLVVATVAGVMAAPDLDVAGMWPGGMDGWRGVLSGAFTAFFAFVGFETLANLGEEVKDPARTMPRGIVGAVVASLVLYVMVSAATVLSERAADRPLFDLFEGRAATTFAAVASVAVANGVLVQIITLARLFYGMAQRGQLPAALAQVAARTGTPTRATALGGFLVVLTAVLIPFEHLLALANTITLGVFVLIDLSLWRVQRRDGVAPGGFSLPGWVPLLAAFLAVSLILAGAFAQVSPP